MDEEALGVTWAVFKSTQILNKGLLDEAPVISGKDYLVVEDLSEDALPATTSFDPHQFPAEKCAQIGKACHSILRGALCGLAGSKPVVLVVDLFAHTGEMCKAVIQEKLKPALSTPMRYIGFHAKPS